MSYIPVEVRFAAAIILPYFGTMQNSVMFYSAESVTTLANGSLGNKLKLFSFKYNLLNKLNYVAAKSI